MNQIASSKSQKNDDRVCGDLLTMAERELAAFVTAVTRLYGPDQAEVSAEDWLKELMAIDYLPASTREWRRLSVKASARIAAELHDENPFSRMPLAFLKPTAEARDHKTME